jgi:deazaflavin-dependent oxidoreductase (nitroreductase family)
MTTIQANRDQAIIDEFRQREGAVGGYFAHMSLLLLHHTGARSGEPRVTPLAMQEIPGGWAVFASKGGADHNPGWYYNLLAHPEASVEVGAERYDVRARVAGGEEYTRIWSTQKERFPQFAEYERRTARDHIPVIVLERT